jgi:hypothetical protein
MEGGRLKDLKDHGLTNVLSQNWSLGDAILVCIEEGNEDNVYLDN